MLRELDRKLAEVRAWTKSALPQQQQQQQPPPPAAVDLPPPPPPPLLLLPEETVETEREPEPWIRAVLELAGWRGTPDADVAREVRRTLREVVSRGVSITGAV